MDAASHLLLLQDESAVIPDFADTLITTYGFDEVWKFTDVSSGTNVPAYVDSNRDGTLSGLDLQNRPTPVVGDSGSQPFYDGGDDYTDLYSDVASVGVKQIFDGNVGTVVLFAQMTTAVLSAGTQGLLWSCSADAINRIWLELNGPNTIKFNFNANTIKTISASSTDSGDVMYACVWDRTGNDEIRMSINGVAQTPQTTLGIWSGALTDFVVGAYSRTPTALNFTGHSCWLAVLFGTALTDQQLSDIYDTAIGA